MRCFQYCFTWSSMLRLAFSSFFNCRSLGFDIDNEYLLLQC